MIGSLAPHISPTTTAATTTQVAEYKHGEKIPMFVETRPSRVKSKKKMFGSEAERWQRGKDVGRAYSPQNAAGAKNSQVA